MNVDHFQQSSDQRALLNFCRVPILTLADEQDESLQQKPQIVIGAGHVTHLSPNDKLAYTELEGNSLESGRQTVLDLEEKMQQMGSKILLGNLTGDLTATSHALATASGDSDLKYVSDLLRDALQHVLDWLGYWLNIDEPGTVETFSDFTLQPSPELAKLMIELARDSIVSRETVWAWLKTAGMLPSCFDEDRELYLLANSVFGDLPINGNDARRLDS